MEQRIFNVCLVGYGLSAKVFQIPFIPLVPQFKLYGIVQRRPKPNDDAAVDHPDVKIYRDFHEMLKDSAIDLVAIGTASNTHFTLCKEALQAGKNVLCEKPFTLTTDEADELISLAADRKLLLTVFHNRRWDADFLTVQALVESGKLGHIVEFESHFDTHSPVARKGWETTWRTQPGTGAGVLYDLGSHLIDQALQLFGKPVKITSSLYYQRPENTKYGDPDSMTILLHYDRLLVTLKSSVMNPEKEKLRFWVRGEKRAYKKVDLQPGAKGYFDNTEQYHLDVQEPRIVEGNLPVSPGFGIEPNSHHGKLFHYTGASKLLHYTGIRKADFVEGTFSSINESGEITTTNLPTVDPPTYLAFYQQLADALAGRGDVPVTAESARDVIQIIELALKSAELEKTIYL